MADSYSHRPWYQKKAVDSYLHKLGKKYKDKFNHANCAYLDVSAQGENVIIAVNGSGLSVAGTSCSSPIFASVVALLNDELIGRGRKPLGFLNPLLCACLSLLAGVVTERVF